MKNFKTVFSPLDVFYCSLEIQEHVIIADPGDDVTLPCKAPNNIIISAVQWIRFDPERYVYLKSDGYLNTAYQDPSYVNRVQLKDDEMKNGELSLILKNVNNNDEGTYECRYVEEAGGRRKRSGENEPISIIQLKVTGEFVDVRNDSSTFGQEYDHIFTVPHVLFFRLQHIDL